MRRAQAEGARNFTRAVIASALADTHAPDLAERRWGSGSPAVRLAKTMTSEGGTGCLFEPGGRAFLAQAGMDAGLIERGLIEPFATGDFSDVQSSREFISAIVERSVLGRMPELRRVPLNRRIFANATNATGSFTKESDLAAVGKLDLADSTLVPLKATAVLAVSKEVLEASDPEAEAWFETELIGACADAISAAFVDPTNAGVTDTKPASVFNGLSGVSATSSASDDLKSLFGAFEGNLENAYLIGAPKTLLSLNDPSRPFAGPRNGEIATVPVLSARGLNGVSGGEYIGLLDASGVAFGTTGGADITISRQGTIEMSDAPDGSGPQVSLWQIGGIGIRVDIYVNWKVMRTSCASLISGAGY